MYTRPEDDSASGDDSTPKQDAAGDLRKNVESRDRRMTVYQARPVRSRWVLHLQAVFWRVLMALGMFFHRMAPPWPPKPDFVRTIQSTISGKSGSITLHFYVPRDYETQRQLWENRPELDEERGGGGGLEMSPVSSEGDDGGPKRRISTSLNDLTTSIRRRRLSVRKWGGYPVVLNFHGGGFTLGSATDDARWCGTVVDECNAVVVSVDYRLAPECPFPTAVEDGVDAVLWIHNHADEFGIDRDKIALSGFSSGGNMAFTVPLRLYDEKTGFPRDDGPVVPPTAKQRAARAINGVATFNKSRPDSSAASSSTMHDSHDEILDPRNPPPSTSSSSPADLTKNSTAETVTEYPHFPDVRIRCIIPWYPSLDYTRTREQRRATCLRKDQELSALFTDLFDESYLHPPDTIALDSPYLSPGVAPTSLLRNALPEEIILHTCEWDMLLDEGQAFSDRLQSEEIGKKVTYKMVEGVPHGWDKAPNPWKPTPGVREHYLKACKEMRRVFGPSWREGRPLVERQTTMGWPSAAPRGSVNVVR